MGCHYVSARQWVLGVIVCLLSYPQVPRVLWCLAVWFHEPIFILCLTGLIVHLFYHLPDCRFAEFPSWVAVYSSLLIVTHYYFVVFPGTIKVSGKLYTPRRPPRHMDPLFTAFLSSSEVCLTAVIDSVKIDFYSTRVGSIAVELTVGWADGKAPVSTRHTTYLYIFWIFLLLFSLYHSLRTQFSPSYRNRLPNVQSLDVWQTYSRTLIFRQDSILI